MSRVTATAPLVWADRLRNVATVLVIIIHVAASIAQDDRPYDTSEWWVGNWWNALGRPAVPLFVMLSGFLLLGKDYSLGYFLQRRFTRVLIPALCWMGIYSYYNFWKKGSPATLAEAALGIAKGPVHHHLWFIYLIIGLYLLYPVLRAWTRSARDEDYLYFTVLFMLGAMGYKILYQFQGWNPGLYVELFTNHAGFFVLGYYLGTKHCADEPMLNPHLRPWSFTRRQLRYIALWLVVLGTAVTALGAWWAGSTLGAAFNPYFYDYLTPNVALASVGWFLWARLGWNGAPLFEVERVFAGTSFGIYFAHVLVMDWWAECGYWHSKYHPALCIPIVSALTVIATFIVVLLIRALPGGERVT
jgi:surface polysaccharide O-acyltransferase-like enzyme